MKKCRFDGEGNNCPALPPERGRLSAACDCHLPASTAAKGRVMACGRSPLWAIETVEKQGVAEEPRSLWDRVESHLRRQEV